MPELFKLCRTFIATCQKENLPKLAVETTLYFAKLARTFESFSHCIKIESKKANEIVPEAKSLLQDAKNLCQQSFQNATELGNAIDQTMNLLRKEWYEEVTTEEVAAIKVSGDPIRFGDSSRVFSI